MAIIGNGGKVPGKFGQGQLLQKKLQSGVVTDPAQQARIKNRLSFLQGQGRMGQSFAGGTQQAQGNYNINPRQFNNIQRDPRNPQVNNTNPGTVSVTPGGTVPVGAKPKFTTQPGVGGTATGANPSAQASSLMSALYPKTSLLDPTKYVNQEMYNWEQGQGTKALDRYYASRGLGTSSAEATGNREFQDKLAANTKADALSMAQQDADRRQTSANRFASMLENEAQRKQQGQQNQFDNMYNMAQLYLNQSPLTVGYNAANNAGSIYSSMASLMGSGGGGGGGSKIPPFQPQFPSGPTQSQADYSQLFGDQASSGQYTNILADIFSGLF